MDSQTRGNLSEAKAYGALRVLQEKYPDMLRGLRRASPGTDARGIDLLIRLNVSETYSRWMTVPIEIKSSMHGVRKWRVVHPEHYEAGVLNFYIPDDMSAKDLQALFYRALDKVRHNSEGGMLYHSWFQKLYEGGLSPRGRENARKIAARRAKDKR